MTLNGVHLACTLGAEQPPVSVLHGGDEEDTDHIERGTGTIHTTARGGTMRIGLGLLGLLMLTLGGCSGMTLEARRE